MQASAGDAGTATLSFFQRAMKFLKHIRSRSKIQSDAPEARLYDQQPRGQYGSDPTARLPTTVLRRILIDVCPHTIETSYNSSEESGTEDGCMLCDMRDLAQCALVSRRWNQAAQDLLYQNVRIDSVHYCEREIELSAKRKRKSFFDRNADPKDVPRERSLLFMRTVREDKDLAVMVQSLRMPYMTRESCKAELARTVSALPNLRFVDLPEGFYSDDPSSNALKHELQAQCPDIRKMKYTSGSERSFTHLPRNRQWQSLEVLELSRLNLEPHDLLYVLGSFPTLHELKLVELPWMDDSIFRTPSSLPPFPPLQHLTLQNIPNVSAAGLATYLSVPQNREVLNFLILSTTGVLPQALHHVLSRAPYLQSVSIIEDISRSFPVDTIPPLASRSLRHLHYEITATHSPHGMQPATNSYYTYLMNSLLSNSLPALRDLYVRDGDFPQNLLLAPPTRPFADPGTQAQSMGLSQPLCVYSKGMDELEWNFTSVLPPEAPGRRGSASATRPLSLYGSPGLSPTWGGGARQSVMVGNGFGGFLAVPSEEGPRRPGSSGGKEVKKKRSKQDLWR